MTYIEYLRQQEAIREYQAQQANDDDEEEAEQREASEKQRQYFEQIEQEKEEKYRKDHCLSQHSSLPHGWERERQINGSPY